MKHLPEGSPVSIGCVICHEPIALHLLVCSRECAEELNWRKALAATRNRYKRNPEEQNTKSKWEQNTKPKWEKLFGLTEEVFPLRRQYPKLTSTVSLFTSHLLYLLYNHFRNTGA